MESKIKAENHGTGRKKQNLYDMDDCVLGNSIALTGLKRELTIPPDEVKLYLNRPHYLGRLKTPLDRVRRPPHLFMDRTWKKKEKTSTENVLKTMGMRLEQIEQGLNGLKKQLSVIPKLDSP